MNCCEQYNEGYLEGRKAMLLAFGGAMLLGGTISMVSIISARKIIKKLNSRKETQK